MSLEKRKVVKVACKKCEGNDQGFYLCYADSVPKGAKIFKPVVKATKQTKKAE
jgi:hypothetical protein